MKNNNEKGSTLVAAVVIIMVIMVILGAALSIASSYYKRSINDITRKQVYISAKAGAELLASYMNDTKGNLLLPLKGGEQKAIQNIEVEGDHTEMSGRIMRISEDTIKIVVKAIQDEYSYEIQLIMKSDGYVWKTKSYCEAVEGENLC